MKRICIVVGSRANYSSIKSVMRAVEKHSELELQLVVTASAVLDRYGSVDKLIEEEGYRINARVNMLIEGENPVTMAKSTGLGLLELPTILDQLKPDFVITVGDRFETMATAIAAAYMNIPLAHTMGGEVTGTIDESIRHAITKFAHVHFAASRDAAERIIKLGEQPADVYNVGCPRIDLVAEILQSNTAIAPNGFMEGGVGDPVDISAPFVIVSQHPVTTEYGEAQRQIAETLEAVRAAGLPAIVLWPNADAGADDIARGIRKTREQGKAEKMHFFKNLPIDVYVRLMAKTACLVGNSSSGIREGAFIGTPVVNIGSRQANRERGPNVIDVDHGYRDILNALQHQIANGSYDQVPVYGDGTAGPQIANILAEKTVGVQKTITY